MIFDAHGDIWTDVTQKRMMGERNIIKKFHFEKYKEGKVDAGIFVIWIDPPYDKDPKKRLIEIVKNMSVEINDNKDIIKIVKKFEDFEIAKKENKFGAMIGLEGLSYIKENDGTIDALYNFGARHASLTWNEENELATGVKGNPDRGLTNLGKTIIKRMEELGIIVDVSHANEKTFWDIASEASKPIIASHSNCKALCDHPRNLTDEQIKEIKNSGGVIGINAFPDFVNKDKKKRNIENLANHIDYIVGLAGIDHVGFGFDFCDFLTGDTMASFAEDSEETVKGLENVSKVPQLISILRQKGYSEKDIEKIKNKNFMRIIKEIIK
jgi:membrane dipeptidase